MVGPGGEGPDLPLATCMLSEAATGPPRRVEAIYLRNRGSEGNYSCGSHAKMGQCLCLHRIANVFINPAAGS